MRLAGAVDIGGTRTKLAVVELAGTDARLVGHAAIATPLAGEPVSLVDGIAQTLGPLLDETRAGGADPAGVGVSVAGFLDRARSAMVANANLPELRDFPLRAALEERLGVPCVLEVDANAAAVAEHRFGAGRGASRLLGVTLGTGLGGGVIVDGALLRYTGECAGDLGHILVEPDGRLCTCGARGCLEALVGAAALMERGGGRSVRDIGDDARRGDQSAVRALAETGWWLGLGLASLAPLFTPDRVTVGGGVAAASDLLLEPTRASFRRHAAPELRDAVRIVGSTFGGWEGVIGAASIFLDVADGR